MVKVAQTVEPTVKTTVNNTQNEEGYVKTNKKYGDYFNDDERKNDLDIYKKDGKSYYKENDGQYNEIVHTTGQRLQPVPTQTKETPKENKKKGKEETKNTTISFDNKKELKYQPKEKKKEEKLSTLNQIKLDTEDLTKEEKKKYKKALLQQEEQAREKENFARRSGTGIDALTGAYNNVINNPNSPIQKEIVKPLENAERIYESGKLNNELALEWYKKAQGKKNNVDEIEKKIQTFNNFNEDIAGGNVGLVGSTIQNLNTQVESLKNQGIVATGGAVIGGGLGALVGLKTGDVAGGALKGSRLGAKAGYTVGSTPYMYKLEYGNEYKDLKEMGVSDEKAKKVATAVGTINAAIESGENIIDLISFSGVGKMASGGLKKQAANQMTDEFGEIIETLGEEQAKSYLEKKFGSEVAESVLKSYAKNIGSEALEEGSQELTSVLGERYAAKSEGIDRGVSWKEDAKRIGQSAAAGGGSALVLGAPTSVVGNTTSYVSGRAQNAINNMKQQNNINTQEQVETTPTRQENEQINTQQAQTRVEPQTIETKPVAKLTQQEQQELDTLKDLPFELNEQQERRMDELLLKQNKDLEKNMSPVRDLSDVRDFNEVGSSKVNAYQYDNPEVKPYFQEVAKDMLYDLDNSTKGERYMTEDGQFKGVKRNVPNDIAELLDGENGVKYSYKEIEDGLNAIIKDNGAENKAVAKRLEFYIDQRLRNGYMDSIAGKIPANNEYIETLRNKNTNGILYENKQENEQTLKINEDGSSEIVDNKPQILENMPQQKTKFTEKLKNWNDKIRHHFTDHQAAIYDMSREFKNPTLYHKADAIMSSDAISQNHLGKKQTNLNGKAYKNFTNENGKKVSMGFEKTYDMYSDIPTKAKNEFLVHNLNLDRLSQGVEQFENITGYESEEKINQLKEKYPDIEKWSNNIYQYYKNQLQNMVDGGLISQQLANEFQTLNPHYVRIQRDVNSKNSSMKTRDGNININNQIQKVKGSSLDILPIKETTAEYTQQVNKSIKLNQFGQELAKTIGVGSTNDNISSIDESFGINPNILSKNGKDYSFTIFNKGQATTIPINEGIYESLQNRDIRNVPILSDAVKVQRNLITNKNPYFAATNAIKDAADMFLYSKHSIPRSFATYMELFGGRTAGRAAQNIKNKTNGTDNRTKTMLWVDLYEGLGGNANSVYADGKFESNKNVVAKGIDKVLSPIEVGNEFIESMPRITEFVNTIRSNGYDINEDGDLVAKKGKTPKKPVDETLNEAMYNAAEVTTNFKRGGTWAKNIDKNGGTFFNASVQGAAKLGRTFTEAFGDAKSGDFKAATRLFSRAMTLGLAPALLSALMYKDDDDYEELPDYVKDQYYLFKTKDNNFIRIPKGRAVSLFDSASRRAIDKAQGKDNVMKGYGNLVMNQIAPSNPLDSNVFSPLVAVSSEQGKSWSGNKIVSDYLATLPKEEQYDAKTSEFSKWLGKELKISPKKADYVIDQYSGVIGDLLLPTMTNYAESGDSSGFNALINPLKSKFTTNSTASNKTITDYYDLVKDVNKQGNSSKATALDKAKQKYIGDYSDVKTKLSSLYAEQREIQNSTKLSDSEKYKQNLEKQREIIELMKKTQKELDEATESDGIITIGNKKYMETYKDGKRKIKSVSFNK